MVKIIGIIIALFIIESDALPNGAPRSACGDLAPQHSPNKATDPFPYKVDVSEIAAYVPGENYSSKSTTWC